MGTIKIRPVALEDNKALAAVIREVLIEMGVPKVGTAYEDKELDVMFETYIGARKEYFIVEEDQKIIGGAGIAQLRKESEKICELQKMYFLPEARGKGLGFQMMNTCLDYARTQGFTKCYLETMPYMKDARKLYTKVGFAYLDAPMGDTGHYSCQAWMIKEL